MEGLMKIVKKKVDVEDDEDKMAKLIAIQRDDDFPRAPVAAP